MLNIIVEITLYLKRPEVMVVGSYLNKWGPQYMDMKKVKILRKILPTSNIATILVSGMECMVTNI